jgi:6-phosphogluconolactonase
MAAAVWVEKLGIHRITLTPAALNHGAQVVFLVCGEGKAEALREVLREGGSAPLHPARLVRPSKGKLLYLVDEAAARLL